MNKVNMLIVLILCAIMFSGCTNNDRVKIVEIEGETSGNQEDIVEGNLSMNAKKIYQYDYNSYNTIIQWIDYASTASWDAENSNNIIVKTYEPNLDQISIRSVDYRYGFFNVLFTFEKDENVTIQSFSENGKKILLEEITEDERILYIYNAETKEQEEVSRVSLEQYPINLFTVESVWIPNSSKVVYGWNFSWYYADGEEELINLQEKKGKETGFPEYYYQINYYDCDTKIMDTTTIMESWMNSNVMMQYSLKVSPDGKVLLYALHDKKHYMNQDSAVLTYDDKGVLSIFYPDIEEQKFTEFWMCDAGIYGQSVLGGLYFYDFDKTEQEWDVVIDDKKSTIIDMVVADDGKTLYIAEATEVIGDLAEIVTDRYYSDRNNIYAYSLEYKKKEYLYKGEGNIIHLEVSPDQTKLLVELSEAFTSEEDGYNIKVGLLIFHF